MANEVTLNKPYRILDGKLQGFTGRLIDYDSITNQAILQIDEYTKVTTTRENIELEDLKVCKENLDKKVNKKETLRDFIRNSETEFHFSHADIDNMSDEELEQYVDYLDALWLK